MKNLLAVATLALAFLAAPAFAHDHASHELPAAQASEAAATETAKSHADCASKHARTKLTIEHKVNKLTANAKHECDHKDHKDCCGEGKSCCEGEGAGSKDCCANHKAECDKHAKKVATKSKVMESTARLAN